MADQPLVSMAAGSVVGFVVMMLTISNRLDAPLPKAAAIAGIVYAIYIAISVLILLVGLGAAVAAGGAGGTGGTTPLILPALLP